MKKAILFLALAIGLNAEILTTKQDGGLLEIKCSQKEDKFYVSKHKFFTNSDKIIIIFEDKSKKNELEKKYNLFDGKVLYGEKFIYEQQNSSIFELLRTLSKEQNVNTVYPNWTTIYNKN